MNVVLAPIGTRGDVQPMAALAGALRRRTHDVTLAGPPGLDGLAPESVPYVPVGPSLREMCQGRLVDQATAMVLGTARQLRAQFDTLNPICRDADVVVGAMLQFAAPSLSELHNFQYFYAVYQPVLVEGDYPTIGVPFARVPRLLRRYLWYQQRALWSLYFRKRINTERMRLSLPPVDDAYEYLVHSGPLLIAYDPVLGALPKGESTVLGCMHGDSKEELASELEAFVSDGEPPVYIGFGSNDSRSPGRLTRTVVEAVARAGVRAVLSAGWAGLGRDDVPDSVHVIDAAPHAELFPRMSAVVHHAGAGTTATASRCGVPQVVIPHMGDQFYWAHRVHAVGIGARPLYRWRLTAARLASSIREALNCAARACQVGDQLKAIDATAEAVAVIESARSTD